ncbi:MAG: universal stress protein [Chthoniobacterales bacterium]
MKTAAIKTAKRSVRGVRAMARREVRIRRILVPTDFSEPSLKALKYGRAMAKQFRATLDLINVFDVQFRAPSLAPLYATDEEIQRRLRQRLRTFAGELGGPIRSGRCHARIGRAFEEVCEAARKLRVDLIVTATHGYSRLKHVLIGSTAERIVRHSPCPVLVVREKEREFVGSDGGKTRRASATLRVQHILVPTDFSEHSRAALAHAIAFAKRFGAKLTLMNVIHPQYYATNPDLIAIDYAMLLDSIHATVRRDMNDFVGSVAFQSVRFHTHIEEGHPGQHIVEYANKHGVDLIVNATHGRTGLAHVLLGSTAEHIVRYAKCPVLVVPRSGSPETKRFSLGKA